MSNAEVMVEEHDGVRTITLNAPQRLNALSPHMMREITRAVCQRGARVVVLRGEGRAFCTGIDLSIAEELHTGDAGVTVDAANELVTAIVDSDAVVVAAIQGACAGVGVSIALACDLSIASENAFFQLSFTRVGLMPDGGAGALVAASAGRAFALRMALLAPRVTAEEALAAGLIAQCVADDDLEATISQAVDVLSTGSKTALARTKQVINESSLGGLSHTMRTERRGQVSLLEANDFMEGVQAFRERRTPKFAD